MKANVSKSAGARFIYFWIKGAAETDAPALGRPTRSLTGKARRFPHPAKAAFNPPVHVYVGCVYSTAWILGFKLTPLQPLGLRGGYLIFPSQCPDTRYGSDSFTNITPRVLQACKTVAPVRI